MRLKAKLLVFKIAIPCHLGQTMIQDLGIALSTTIDVVSQKSACVLFVICFVLVKFDLPHHGGDTCILRSGRLQYHQMMAFKKAKDCLVLSLEGKYMSMGSFGCQHDHIVSSIDRHHQM